MSSVVRVTGTVVGRYDLDLLLGRGGMGEVWLAHDRRLAREVAVKLLRPDLATDPTVRARFEHEAQVAARLTHPNVVAVFDCGDDEGEPFIVMERLPGRSLADALRTGPIAIDRAERWAAELLAALDAAHRAGVLHRDIKPSNVLLTAHDSIKVADFGIAKAAETRAATATGIVLGTAAYLAPERLEGQPATPASDQYAAAVVLYEVIAGQPPFAGEQPLALVNAIRQGGAAPLRQRRPDAPPALAAAIERGMAADPSDRHASVAAMLAALPGAAGASDAHKTMPIAVAPTVVADIAARRAEGTSAPPPRQALWIAMAIALTIAIALGVYALGQRAGAGPTTPSTVPTTSSPTTTVHVTTTTERPTTTTAPGRGPGKGKGNGNG